MSQCLKGTVKTRETVRQSGNRTKGKDRSRTSTSVYRFLLPLFRRHIFCEDRFTRLSTLSSLTPVCLFFPSPSFSPLSLFDIITLLSLSFLTLPLPFPPLSLSSICSYGWCLPRSLVYLSLFVPLVLFPFGFDHPSLLSSETPLGPETFNSPPCRLLNLLSPSSFSLNGSRTVSMIEWNRSEIRVHHLFCSVSIIQNTSFNLMCHPCTWSLNLKVQVWDGEVTGGRFVRKSLSLVTFGLENPSWVQSQTGG